MEIRPPFLFWQLFCAWWSLMHTVPQEGQKRPALKYINDCAKKCHYFSILKIVFKTWFQRPCFCNKKNQMDVFKTLHGLLSSWWPNQVIIWYFKSKKVLNIFRNYMFCGNLFKSTNLQYHKKNHIKKLIHRVTLTGSSNKGATLWKTNFFQIIYFWE